MFGANSVIGDVISEQDGKFSSQGFRSKCSINYFVNFITARVKSEGNNTIR